jgi:hypothetical protein
MASTTRIVLPPMSNANKKGPGHVGTAVGVGVGGAGGGVGAADTSANGGSSGDPGAWLRDAGIGAQLAESVYTSSTRNVSNRRLLT